MVNYNLKAILSRNSRAADQQLYLGLTSVEGLGIDSCMADLR